jgi:hypothetical protein
MDDDRGAAWFLEQHEIQQAIAAYCDRQGSRRFDADEVTITSTAHNGIVATAIPREAKHRERLKDE